MSKAPAITAADFDTEVLQSEVPVMVDFYASWCGPCRAIAPAVDALAVQMEGKAKVFKLDVDAEPDIESRYGVRSIPTLIIFKNGEPVDRVVGAQPQVLLAEKLQAQF